MIEKVLNTNTLVVKDLFKKETTLSLFFQKKVYLQSEKFPFVGTIIAGFGSSGKVKVNFSENVETFKTELPGLPIYIMFEKKIQFNNK